MNVRKSELNLNGHRCHGENEWEYGTYLLLCKLLATAVSHFRPKYYVMPHASMPLCLMLVCYFLFLMEIAQNIVSGPSLPLFLYPSRSFTRSIFFFFFFCWRTRIPIFTRIMSFGRLYFPHHKRSIPCIVLNENAPNSSIYSKYFVRQHLSTTTDILIGLNWRWENIGCVFIL